MTLHQNEEISEELTHRQVCTLHIGEEQFAVPLTDIVEVTGAVVLSLCPLAPAYIGGWMQYRGEVLAAICLRTLLGMERCNKPASSMIVNGTRGMFALLVDSIGEVLPVANDSYESVPSTVETQRQQLLAGAYKLDYGLLPLLDAKRLEPSALRSHSTQMHRSTETA